MNDSSSVAPEKLYRALTIFFSCSEGGFKIRAGGFGEMVARFSLDLSLNRFVLMEEELVDFFKVAASASVGSSVLSCLSSSAKVANLSLFFLPLPVTESTALDAHPDTLFLLGFSFCFSLSPTALTLPFRFRDARDVGRDEGLLADRP